MEDVIKDERTIVVENASYRLGYIILLFGVLLDVLLRGLVRRGTLPDPMSLVADNWDLLGLAIVSSGVATAYQGVHRTLGHIRGRRILLTMVAAAAASVLLGWLLH